jgi:hypothetical protein
MQTNKSNRRLRTDQHETVFVLNHTRVLKPTAFVLNHTKVIAPATLREYNPTAKGKSKRQRGKPNGKGVKPNDEGWNPTTKGETQRRRVGLNDARVKPNGEGRTQPRTNG